MKITRDLLNFGATTTPIALTIGYFDGIHLGHQALLTRLKELAPYTVVFTFENHPSNVLHNTQPSHLTTLSHRLSILEKMGIDHTILNTFTPEFAKQKSKDFLYQLKEAVPFSFLVLGHDAIIGSDRQANLYELSEELGFTVEYLKPVQLNGKIISSSEIRKYILEGHLSEAGQLLGRPYSIYANVQHGAGIGGALGFHTANLPVEDLALPPLGVYAVKVKIGDALLPAVANLGHAPTLHQNRPPCLEVHLINDNRNLYGVELEVLFLKYLRPEKRFSNVEELKIQIQKDIDAAKHYFS